MVTAVLGSLDPPERLGLAPERLGFAPERLGFAPERLGFAPERLGLAPERLGFAGIRKPATLMFGFWQGELEYVHGKPVVLAKMGRITRDSISWGLRSWI